MIFIQYRFFSVYISIVSFHCRCRPGGGVLILMDGNLFLFTDGQTEF